MCDPGSPGGPFQETEVWMRLHLSIHSFHETKTLGFNLTFFIFNPSPINTL